MAQTNSRDGTTKAIEFGFSKLAEMMKESTGAANQLLKQQTLAAPARFADDLAPDRAL